MTLALQRRYSLSDEDFAVLPELEESESGDTGRFVITDIGGRNLLPFHRLAEDFDACVLDAYRSAIACPCRDGCFRCVRAQPTRFIFPLASKTRAIELLGALLGTTPLRPSLPDRPALEERLETPVSPVSLKLKGQPGSQVIEWRSAADSGSVALAGRPETEALLDALRCAMEFIPAGTTMRLETNKPYIEGYLTNAAYGHKVDPEWRWFGLKYRWRKSDGA
jgi:hypothetical protein